MKRFLDLLAVVDLDESTYAPMSAPTVFNSTELRHNLPRWEDPRLFVHRGELYVLLAGLYLRGNKTRQSVAQFIARLERLQPAANTTTGAGSAAPAGFQMVYLRQLLVPENVPSALTLPRDINIQRTHDERNWVPFIYNDTVHFIYSLNPPVVLRVSSDRSDAEVNADIHTEFVSDGGNAAVRWRYGVMRGGTPAIYDADVGGYVALFHSHDKYRLRTPKGVGKNVTFYFMGFVVFAPQPPFSIQMIGEAPLMGPGFYNESARSAYHLRVIWPGGLLISPEEYVVSYGMDDNTMRAVRVDRQKLLQTLQAPLPQDWNGHPC